MLQTTEADRAASLERAIGALPVEIDHTQVEISEVLVPSYGELPRPTSITRVTGGGITGRGEHVGWTHEAHESFRKHALSAMPTGRFSVQSLATKLKTELSDPYDRAALEAAAIDLALRQAQTRAESLLSIQPRPTRYVLSLSPQGEPGAAIRQTLGQNHNLEIKIDVDPEWKAAEFESVAANGRVAVLDWKKKGNPRAQRLATKFFPTAIQEDPGPDPMHASPGGTSRRSIDGPFIEENSLISAAKPFAANIKPARMGGVLEALRGASYCIRNGIQVYFGGMFELDIGRHQLLALASLISPDGPNDIAPIERAKPLTTRPERLHVSNHPGFR